MEKLTICRVCLAENVRMYVVVNRNLHELYEKLTDNPFVTKDSRPNLICYFCCTKLKQCSQFQRKCLEAEELFAQMINEDYKLNPLKNQDHPEFSNGLIQTPMELISIAGVCDILDDVIEPKKEHQSDEQEVENQENSFSDVEDKPALHSESDSEDDQLLMEFKIEVKEHEVLGNKQRASDMQKLKLDDVDKSYPDVEDTPAVQAESNSEDVPLMEVKLKAEYAQESTETPVAKKPKLDTRRPKPRDTISAEQKKNEYNRKLSSFSKIIMKSQNITPNRTNKFKNPFSKTQHGVCGSINNTDLSTSFQNNSKRDNIKCKILNTVIDISQRSFSKECNLISHVRKYIREKPFKCEICQRSFYKKSQLVRHIRTHTGVKPFNCDNCQRSFKQKCRLVRHTRTYTGEKPFSCDICQRSFKGKSNLVSHIRTHTGEKPFNCDSCQRSFTQKGHLLRHTRTHTGEKPFNCNVCQRSFNQMVTLVRHTRTHTGEKPFNCDICQRSFKDKYNFVTHTRTHTGEKPFSCDICQRCFKYKPGLVSHIRTHTGEKPFNCDICQRSFSDKSNLGRHTRTHTCEKPFNCDICQRSYKNRCSFVRHTRTHTGEKRFDCDICQRSYKNRSSLVNHIRTHYSH